MEKVQIKESEVIKMIHEGKSREEVGAFYGLDNADTVALFKHEAFKGLRAKKQRAFVIVRDEDIAVDTSNTTEDIIEDNAVVEEKATEEIFNEVDTDDVKEEPVAEEVEAIKEEPAKWD